MAQRIVESPLICKDLPPISASMYLLGHLLQHQDKQLIIDCLSGRSWNGKEIYDMSISIADAFINVFKLQIGEVVCFWCPNSDVHAITFIAVLASASIYVPCSEDFSYYDVYKVAKLSKAKFLIISSEHIEQATKLMMRLSNIKYLFVIGKNNETNNLHDIKNCYYLENYLKYNSKPEINSLNNKIPITVELNDVAIVHFVKQSRNNLPKQLMPIVKTHFNLVQSAGQLHHCEVYHIDSTNCVLPKHFSHYFGITMLCHALVAGSRIALTDKLNKQQTMAYIQKYQVTNAMIDLTELLYLLRNDVAIRVFPHCLSKLDHDFSSLTDIMHCGSPLPHSDVLTEETFKKLKPNYFRAMYGKTETGIISCVWKSLSTFGNNNFNLFTVGFLVPGVQVKIIDPKTERARPKNKIGEICVKSKQSMPGYWNLPKFSEKAFTSDGFFKTGDAGYFDERGLLYYECRVNELIYSGVEEIMPLSLETILLKHNSVKEVAVIGIEDEIYGEVARAFVVLESNISSNYNKQILLDYLQKRGKQLKGGIVFLKLMPKTKRGKANRPALRVINDNLHTYSFLELL